MLRQASARVSRSHNKYYSNRNRNWYYTRLKENGCRSSASTQRIFYALHIESFMSSRHCRHCRHFIPPVQRESEQIWNEWKKNNKFYTKQRQGIFSGCVGSGGMRRKEAFAVEGNTIGCFGTEMMFYSDNENLEFSESRENARTGSITCNIDGRWMNAGHRAPNGGIRIVIFDEFVDRFFFLANSEEIY